MASKHFKIGDIVRWKNDQSQLYKVLQGDTVDHLSGDKHTVYIEGLEEGNNEQAKESDLELVESAPSPNQAESGITGY
jgi:hypothetical protein